MNVIKIGNILFCRKGDIFTSSYYFINYLEKSLDKIKKEIDNDIICNKLCMINRDEIMGQIEIEPKSIDDFNMLLLKFSYEE